MFCYPITLGCCSPITNFSKKLKKTIVADFQQEGIVTTLHAIHDAFDSEKYLELRGGHV
jgi:hypothetical protein